MTARPVIPPIPDTAAARAPQRQRRKEARPQELLDAALDLFVERGFARGEFRAGLNVPEVVHAIVAPLVLMAMNKHSLGACSTAFLLDPKAIMEAVIDLALHGLQPRPAR